MSEISKLFSQNKKTLFLILGMGLFLSLVPLHSAYADPGFCDGCSWTNPVRCFSCVLEYLVSLPFRLPFFILVLVIGIIALVGGLLLGLATALLTWAIEVFLSVPIIHAGVVEAGWTFSRDFANMFFILALVFIGLSTILRIREYEAKKALPILILIAILINFTPVIVGFIVDMSNIVTDFFVQDVGGLSSIGEKTSVALDFLVRAMKDTFLINGQFFEHLLPYDTQPGIIADFTGLIIYGLVLIVYFLLAALIYLLIVMVFFFRIIILWVLTILAPIAFLSKIFPATKETKMIFPSILHWDEWWEKLIQWSIVGIPIGFFLYLSNYVLGMDINTLFGANTLNTQLTGQGFTGAFASMILSILSPVVALVLLIWGAMISLNAAPAGARGRVTWGKKFATGAAKLGGRYAGTALGRRIAPGLEKWGQRLTARGLIPAEAPKGVKGVFAKAVGLTGIPKISRFGARQLGRGIEIGGRELKARVATQDEKEIGDAEKQAAKRNSADNINDVRKAFYRRDMNAALGFLKGTINNGDTNDIIDAVKDGRLNWKDIARVYQTAGMRGTPHRRLMEKAFLPWALDKKDEQGNIVERNSLGVSAENQEKIFDKIKTSDIADEIIDPRSIDPSIGGERAQRALDAILQKGDSQLVPQLLRTKKKHRDAIWQYIQQSKNPEWFIDNNREDILRWSASTAARGLGLGSIGGLEAGQIEGLIAQRQTLGLTDDQLKTKRGNLELELPEASGDRKRNVEREIERISGELNLRDKAQNPDAELVKRKINLDNQLEELSEQKPEEMTADDYRNRAVAQRDLARVERELKRRDILETAAKVELPAETEIRPQAEEISQKRRAGQIAPPSEAAIREIMEKEGVSREQALEKWNWYEAERQLLGERMRGVSVPVAPAEQPLAVQIAELKEKEADIRKQIPHLYGLARKREKKELENTKAQREKLQGQFDEQPKTLQNTENSILKERRDIQKNEKDLATYEGTIQELNNEAKEIGEELETARKENDTQAIVELERQLQKNQTDLQARQRERDDIKQRIDEARGHLKGLMTDWQEYKHPEAEKAVIEMEEERYRGKLKEAVQKEEGTRQNLARLRIQRVGPEEMATAEKEFAAAKKEREKSEREFAKQLKLGTLTVKREKAEAKIKNMKTQMEQKRTTAKRLDTEIDGINRGIESINKGFISQQTRLDSVRSEREELVAQVQVEILKEHPQWKTVPPKMIKEKEKSDPRFAPLDAEIKTAQTTFDRLKRNLENEETILKKLREESKEATSKYNALIRAKETVQRGIEKIESELEKIESGEVVPELPEKERKKLK